MKKTSLSVLLVLMVFLLVSCSSEPEIDYKDALKSEETTKEQSDTEKTEESELELVEKATQEFGDIFVTTGLSSDDSKLIKIDINNENGMIVTRDADGDYSFLLGFDGSDLAAESLCYSVALLFVTENDGTMMTSSGDDVGAHTFKDGKLVYGYGFSGEKYLDLSMGSEIETLNSLIEALEYTIAEIQK